MDEEVTETPFAPGAGNALLIELQFEHVTEVVGAIGEKGRLAESVAQAAAQKARAYIEADAPVSPHLADQLLLPPVQGGGGGSPRNNRSLALRPH